VNGLSIIIASSGRVSLARTLESLSGQLLPGDQLIVDVNDDSPWGHIARNRSMAMAREGNGLCFMDDDDVYLPDALEIMRDCFLAFPESIHVFRMLYFGTVLWRTPDLVCGNISTQMFVVPRDVAVRHKWGDRYEGVFDFISAAAEHESVVWHEELVAHYRA
jgi:glycosyltransferase involved in cell wall biosynthesis